MKTFLQSWEQGERVWGKVDMAALWGAATVRVVGSGLASVDFLEGISRLIGDYDAPQLSRSTGRGQGPSYSYSTHKERIMDLADLAALSKGRCIVIGAGARPVLVRTLPLMVGRYAAATRASILRYDPAGKVTVERSTNSVRAVVASERTAITAGQVS